MVEDSRDGVIRRNSLDWVCHSLVGGASLARRGVALTRWGGVGHSLEEGRGEKRRAGGFEWVWEWVWV